MRLIKNYKTNNFSATKQSSYIIYLIFLILNLTEIISSTRKSRDESRSL